MIRIAVVTISDSVVAGTRVDRSGSELRERVESLGWAVEAQPVVADERDQIAALLASLADSGRFSVVLTTGGTGVALRDVTPEATRDVLEREIPGLPELMRTEGHKATPFAVLSRAVAGTRGRCLIVNLPGSPKGAVESFNAISQLLPHIVDLMEGRTGHTDVPH
jgi:molybdenum cofactor synthesis domain-containing protein